MTAGMLHGKKKDIKDIQDREIQVFVFGFEGMTQRMKLGSMVKRLRHRPFTAVTRVRFPLESYGILAQLGEHLPYKQRVIGSSPIGPI